MKTCDVCYDDAGAAYEKDYNNDDDEDDEDDDGGDDDCDVDNTCH